MLPKIGRLFFSILMFVCVCNMHVYIYIEREKERDETKRIQKITVCKFVWIIK